MARVKICGITSLQDALAAADAGADLLGLNFYPKSPRYIAPETARKLVSELQESLSDRCPALVGLFVNEPVEGIRSVMNAVGIQYVQLSGDEPVEALAALNHSAYKAIRPRSIEEAEMLATRFCIPDHSNRANECIPSLLVDAYNPVLFGGTGERANYAAIMAAKKKVDRLMIAGGLTPENVGGIVSAVQPWGVDVASGIEIDGSPGKKDPVKMRDFVQSAKQA